MVEETHSGVLIFSERDDVVHELLSKGRELADQLNTMLSAISCGSDASDRAEEYIAQGADNVYTVVNPFLDLFDVEVYTDAFMKLVKEQRPSIFLIGATKRGKELAPRVAQRLGVGCETECTNLSLEDGNLVIERMIYGGNAIATEVYRTKPQIATVPPRRFESLERDDSRKGEVVEFEVEIKEPRTKLVETRDREVGAIRIEDAEIIVSAGRGFRGKEDLQLVMDLTKAVGGICIGCSRPISADLKWLPEDHWVGLSGHKVRPKLYVAVGISGQVQHLAGMRDSQVIVAINKDPDAPIFKAADYGIIGDLYEVVPKLISIFKSILKR